MSSNELVVFTVAKDLCKYVFEVTDKSPKKFRFSLTVRMHNLASETIENLYRANDIFVGSDTFSKTRALQRIQHQKDALSSVKLLGFIALIANEQQAITNHQYEYMSKLLANVQYLIAAWLKKDSERYGV